MAAATRTLKLGHLGGGKRQIERVDLADISSSSSSDVRTIALLGFGNLPASRAPVKLLERMTRGAPFWVNLRSGEVVECAGLHDLADTASVHA